MDNIYTPELTYLEILELCSILDVNIEYHEEKFKRFRYGETPLDNDLRIYHLEQKARYFEMKNKLLEPTRVKLT